MTWKRWALFHQLISWATNAGKCASECCMCSAQFLGIGKWNWEFQAPAGKHSNNMNIFLNIPFYIQHCSYLAVHKTHSTLCDTLWDWVRSDACNSLSALQFNGVALAILWFPEFLTHDSTALCTLEPGDWCFSSQHLIAVALSLPHTLWKCTGKDWKEKGKKRKEKHMSLIE